MYSIVTHYSSAAFLPNILNDLMQHSRSEHSANKFKAYKTATNFNAVLHTNASTFTAIRGVCCNNLKRLYSHLGKKLQQASNLQYKGSFLTLKIATVTKATYLLLPLATILLTKLIHTACNFARVK